MRTDVVTTRPTWPRGAKLVKLGPEGPSWWKGLQKQLTFNLFVLIPYFTVFSHYFHLLVRTVPFIHPENSFSYGLIFFLCLSGTLFSLSFLVLFCYLTCNFQVLLWYIFGTFQIFCYHYTIIFVIISPYCSGSFPVFSRCTCKLLSQYFPSNLPVIFGIFLSSLS